MREEGLTEEVLAHVADYRERPEYSPAEKVAIEYAERFSLASADIDDELFERLHEHFDDAEILDLTILCAKYVGMGRLTEVLRLDQQCSLSLD